MVMLRIYQALYFEEPIKDYIRIIGAVKNALSTRNAKRLTYETATSDLKKAQAAHDALVGKPGKEEAVHTKEQEVATRQGKVDAAKTDFEAVQQRVMGEIGRFKEEKLADFKTIVLDYVQLQIEYNQKVEEMWKELMPTLNAIDADAPLSAAAAPAAAAAGGGAGEGEGE